MVYIASFGCSFCGSIHGDRAGASACEKNCIRDYWLEQTFSEPRDQCKVCRWEGHVYNGEPDYHCKRNWEMPKELQLCEGWQPKNIQWDYK
jgi:hypothetical protein